MSYRSSQGSYRSRPHYSEPDSPSVPGSGVVTPTGSSASYLPTSVSSFWGGLVRRFSAETPTSYSTSSSPNSSFHHSRTMPDRLDGVGGVYTPPRIPRTASPMAPPPLDPIQLHGYAQDTTPDARLLSTTIAEEIRIMVPTRLAIVDDWNLVYSLDQDGASLATLYEKCAHFEGKRVGFVLVVKDCEGGVFGAYLSDYPHPAPKYFGNGECFLWRASVMASLPPPPSADTTHLTARTTTIAAHLNTNTNTLFVAGGGEAGGSNSTGSLPPRPASPSVRFKAFPYSGVNDYYMLCDAHFLSVGAGDGKYGLWLDDGLEKGISSTCLTFGNERLSDEGEKFGILGVEVWVIGG